MANQETQKIDSIIASRRAMLMGTGAAALAALTFTPKAKAAATVGSYSDNDILNFALNLEYLEANFYYLAAFGCTINSPNTAALAAGAPSGGIAITGMGTAGTVTAPATTKVPFTRPAVAGYAVETAIEEGKHVLFLRTALGSAAVAQPALNLNTSFASLATLAGITNPNPFSPYTNDVTFLVGAYIFEDVGVTAYHGAAPLISTSATGKTLLAAASGILAVEAYHAGLIRSTINQLDPDNTLGYLTYTQQISALRSSVAKAVAPTAYPSGFPASLDPTPDDIALSPSTGPGTSVVSVPTGSVTEATTADATTDYKIAFARTTNEVLNIVTAGGAATAGTKATGGFFPSGLNGTFI